MLKNLITRTRVALLLVGGAAHADDEPLLLHHAGLPAKR